MNDLDTLMEDESEKTNKALFMDSVILRLAFIEKSDRVEYAEGLTTLIYYSSLRHNTTVRY